MEEKILVQSSSEQKIEYGNNAIKLIYGQCKQEKNLYVISKEETLNDQIINIKEIIEKNKINRIEIHDINNSIALIEVCNELKLPYVINIAYPINWVCNFAKYYFNGNPIADNTIIKYNDDSYCKQYKKFFQYKERKNSNLNNLEDIRATMQYYDNKIDANNARMTELQEYANYLSSELNNCKSSMEYKIAIKIRPLINIMRKTRNKLRYISKYGIVKTLKKLYYKIERYKDVPLWEEQTIPHYSDLYEFKFKRYKDLQNSHCKIHLQDIKHDFNKNLVSIILPVYNGEDKLREALESIQKQTYKKFECIMVNDGSTDESLKIMQEYANKDTRFTIIDQENGKLPKALNNGFKSAKGEFYTWTSCDNNMHPQYIKRMVKQLKQDKSVDFIYADLKLIDEDSNILRGFGWYEIPEDSGNVILPDNINHLNIYPNNYIGAAFMYRSTVHQILSDYSEKRYTVEDYDYWQRINSLFNIKKAKLSEPLYYYRFHSKSLTAQADKLKINDKRDKMMVYDDFRRDYYIMPLCWILEYDEKSKETYEKIKKILKKNDQVIINREIYNSNSYSKKYSNTICLYIGDKKEQEKNLFSVRIRKNGKKADLKFKHINGNEYKFTSHLENILKTVEIMAKDYYTIQYENDIYTEEKYEKDLSIVICTYKRNKQLEEAIISSINQSEDKKNYEIIVVNNDIETNDIWEIVKNYRKKYNLNENFLRYFVAPVKGLSYARNVGLFEAKGKNILYIDDDSICNTDIVKEVVKAFKDNPNAGVIGGDITLKVPQSADGIYLEQYAGLWSQYKVSGEQYIDVDNWYDYPYGANFAVSRYSLLQIGGFRTTYGRKENNFSGGEEIVVSSMISKMKKNIILAPRLKVTHAISEDRFSKEHIKKTYYNGMLTWYRLYLDMYIDESIGIDDINYKLKLIEQKEKTNNSEIEQYYIDCEKQAIEDLKNYYYKIEKERNV